MVLRVLSPASQSISGSGSCSLRSRPTFLTPLIFCEGCRAPPGRRWRCSELEWKQAPLTCRSLWSASVQHIEKATLVFVLPSKIQVCMLLQHCDSTLFIKVSFPAVSSCVWPAIDDKEDGRGKTTNVAPDVRRCVVSGSTQLCWGHWVRLHARWRSTVTLTNDGVPLLIPGVQTAHSTQDGGLRSYIVVLFAFWPFCLCEKLHGGKMRVLNVQVQRLPASFHHRPTFFWRTCRWFLHHWTLSMRGGCAAMTNPAAARTPKCWAAFAECSHS